MTGWDSVVADADAYFADGYSIAGTVVAQVVASAEKGWCRQEHGLDMTEYGLEAAAVEHRQVLGKMSNVDTPGGSLALKVGLEYTQDE